jgi:exosortase
MTHPVLAELKTFLPRPAIRVAWIVLAVVLVLSYWTAIGQLFASWCDEDYQYGWFVPPFAAVLLYLRREMIRPLPTGGSLWGIAFLALAGLMSWTSVVLAYESLDPWSIIPCLTGLVILMGGWRALQWAWPSLVILIFMYPLPGFLQDWGRYQLQHLATIWSAYMLQTFGIAVAPPGDSNIIMLPGGPLNVDVVCSGLRMLMLFFAICVGASFVMRRPLWQKIVVLLSAIPFAVVANVSRITATGLVQEIFALSPDAIDEAHKWAGVVIMMPLGLLLLWGELAILGNLFIEPPSDYSVALGQSLGHGGPLLGPPAHARRKKSP